MKRRRDGVCDDPAPKRARTEAVDWSCLFSDLLRRVAYGATGGCFFSCDGAPMVPLNEPKLKAALRCLVQPLLSMGRVCKRWMAGIDWRAVCSGILTQLRKCTPQPFPPMVNSATACMLLARAAKKRTPFRTTVAGFPEEHLMWGYVARRIRLLHGVDEPRAGEDVTRESLVLECRNGKGQPITYITMGELAARVTATDAMRLLRWTMTGDAQRRDGNRFLTAREFKKRGQIPSGFTLRRITSYWSGGCWATAGRRGITMTELQAMVVRYRETEAHYDETRV